MSRLINIDCDGVLVSNNHEELLNAVIKMFGLSYSDLSPVWDWYGELIHTTPLPLNIPMLKVLQGLKDNGHILRVWTNRSYTLEKPTLDNLGGWKSLFDSFEFHSGRKHLSEVEGVVIDNLPQYLSCGETGVLYPTFK